MDEMIRLNVGALARLTYAAAPGLVARGDGTIVNRNSSLAISPETLNEVYGGTKAFVLALSVSLKHELAGKGGRVPVVLPGATAAGLPVDPDENVAEEPLVVTIDLDNISFIVTLAAFSTSHFTVRQRLNRCCISSFVTAPNRLFAGTGAIHRAIGRGENYVGRQPGLRGRCGIAVTYLDSVDRSKAVDASIDARRVD